jgi:MFS transporter, ceroid-lipofuscinosis neuronal protein 7
MQGQEEGLKSFLGWVVAAQPLAQLFFSPLMGFLGNKFGTVRYLMMITMVILTGGFIFYACIGALPCPRKFYLVIGRLIIGAAAGTTTLCFSYVAGATTVDERTKAFGLFSFAMASAFVLGPVIQSAFVTLGEVGYYMGVEGLYFNVYTGPSWLAALLAMLNLILYVPCLPIFKEYYIAEKEGKLEAAKAKAKDPGTSKRKNQ